MMQEKDDAIGGPQPTDNNSKHRNLQVGRLLRGRIGDTRYVVA